MANNKSAEKNIRQTTARTRINRERLGMVRAAVRDVETQIATGDKAKALIALRTAQPVIHSGVNKKVLHRNTAARKLSRLTARINKL